MRNRAPRLIERAAMGRGKVEVLGLGNALVDILAYADDAYLIAQDMAKGAMTLPQFSSVAQSCPTLCYPMNRSTPGLPVHHQLPEFTQIHVHRVCDAIQPSHPLSSPSTPAPNPSQHQSLFQ